jgi:hypothetical protein
VVKEKYVELCMKKLDLNKVEAERTVNYLEAMMLKVIKDEIEKYENRK